MKITLAIPTWNGGRLLDRVLDAVDRQPGASEIERIAIDSGSRDGTIDVLRRHGFRVEHIPQSRFNHGATRDLMIEASSGQVIVLLTQDAIPADSRWLSELVGSYEDPAVGAAYCKQIPREDCNPFIARRLREWTAGKDSPMAQDPLSQIEFDALEPMERLRRCAFDNVASSVRKSAWRALGGFGRRRFGEDVAFGKKLVLGGWRIVFQARSSVIHSHNRSPREEGRRIYCDHQNLRELFGIRLLPTLRSYRDARRWGRKAYAEVVDSLGLSEREAATLREWAVDYAHEAARGMFLGAGWPENSTGPHAARFRAIDEYMHRGI